MDSVIPQSVYDQVMNSRVTMVIGAVDTGKSTVVGFLAKYIVAQGRRCGIVDADMGQSTIGPPTTIGMGEFVGGMENIHESRVKSIYFVGAPSPRGHLLPTVIGTKKMVDAAVRSGFDNIIIDTTGVIQGGFGETLKGYKIELVQPDCILFLQRSAECVHLIRRTHAVSDAAVWIVRPSESASTRSAEERREFRDRTLRAYFLRSSEVTVDCRQVWITDAPFSLGHLVAQGRDRGTACESPVMWAERSVSAVHVICEASVPAEGGRKPVADAYPGLTITCPAEAVRNTLVGLYNEDHECFSLGVVRGIDFDNQRMRIAVAEHKASISGVRFSRYSVNPDEPGLLSCCEKEIVVREPS
ncbi:MAG TPA: Clp1/GlmU family protein [Thermodesulfobacteriota bacterium]|nr:hypothetical protein [Deltaproteobacteria bacterium]HNR14654.1 Clp1/GlmU family protein [Thermodesulfobacteriota bacterium]HOC39502.1 Clp1/GlmU family protein [Thermodesulfobacteriota bacterium]